MKRPTERGQANELHGGNRDGGALPGATRIVRKLIMRLAVFTATVAVLAQVAFHEEASAAGELVFTQVAVQQGDAAVIQGPCGELGLIDTNSGRRSVAAVLKVMDAFGTRELKWIAVSHYDKDHVGGIVDVATSDRVSVGRVYDRGGDRQAKDSIAYHRYFDWARSQRRERVEIGRSFSLCSDSQEVLFEVVSVGTDGKAVGEERVVKENDKGLCLKIEFGSFDAATCGDASGTGKTDVETQVALRFGEVEFAKINHHGSEYSSNDTYVGTLKAKAAVVSTGANPPGHPIRWVLARWCQFGDVYQTQNGQNNPVDGNVTVTTDGQTGFTVETSASGVRRDYPLHEMPGSREGPQPRFCR